MPTRREGESSARSDWTKPLRNAGRLAAGRGVQAVCSLVYLAIAARALGPTGFGALVLVHGLALAVSQFSSFGSKEMLVRFGALALASPSDPGKLRALIHYGIVLDILGTALAWGFMALAANWAFERFEIPGELHAITIGYWFAAVALTNLSQTPTGLLRLFDRFHLIAYQSTIEPVLRLVLAALMFHLHAGLHGFLIAWFVALLAGRLCLVVMARRQLHKEHLPQSGRIPLARALNPEPGIWKFVLWVQWTTTIGLVDTQLPLLAVGSMADTASAGLFKVAQQVTSVLDRANSKLVVPSLYTELARLHATGAEAECRHLVRKTTGLMIAFALGIFVLLALFGKYLLVLVAGIRFVDAYPVMLWLAGAAVVATLSVTLEPLLMASGRIRSIAVAGTLPLAVYIPLVFGVVGPGELVGVGVATVAYALLNSGALVIAARPAFASRSSGAPV